MKQIYFFEGKSINRRVRLYVLETSDGIVYFNLVTKRLTDRKTRQIMATDHLYSYATFRSIFEIMIPLFGSQGFKESALKTLSELGEYRMDINTNINMQNNS